MKKNLRTPIALALCLTLICCLLTACGSGESKETPPPSQPAAEVTYTFAGSYISSQSDVHFDFTMEMLSDGTLNMIPGVVFLDVEDYEATASGKWSEANGALSFNIDNEDGTFTKSYEVPLENGGYQFSMDLSLASFVRPVIMTCTTQGFIPEPPAEPSEEPSAPMDDNAEGSKSGYPANTMVLDFTPDTSDQLKTTFFCESGVWGPALGATGAYGATDSTDELFAWSNEGSYVLSFKADGTYEYQFEKVGIVENGTWTFEGWTLTATTANGNTYTAEITK